MRNTLIGFSYTPPGLTKRTVYVNPEFVAAVLAFGESTTAIHLAGSPYPVLVDQTLDTVAFALAQK